jgi:hypothetical protein
VAGDDVHRVDHFRIGRYAVHAVHPLVHRDAIDDIEKPIVDASRMEQPVVLHREARGRRNSILKTATTDTNWSTPYGVAGEGDVRSCGNGLARLVGDDNLFGEHGRQLQIDRDRPGVGDRNRLDGCLKRWGVGAKRVGAGCDVADSKFAVGGGHHGHRITELIDQGDLGRIDRRTIWTCERAGDRALLKLRESDRRETSDRKKPNGHEKLHRGRILSRP